MAEQAIDCIKQVAAHHADFVDDQEFELVDHRLSFGIQAHLAQQRVFVHDGLLLSESSAPGNEGHGGQLEKTMDGGAAGMDGRHARRCHHGGVFEALFPAIFQKCGFACSGFSGQEYRLAGVAEESGGQFKMAVGDIGYGGLLHASKIRSAR